MSITEQRSITRQVLICQYKSCRKNGAEQILAAFQAQTLPNVDFKPVRCLGQCGNGPLVLILPEEVWYWRVLAAEVNTIIEQHLQGNCPVTEFLYPKFHSQSRESRACSINSTPS